MTGDNSMHIHILAIRRRVHESLVAEIHALTTIKRENR